MTQEEMNPQEQADWNNLLEQYEGAYDQASEFQSWKPPPGETTYSAFLTGVRTGVKEQDDEVRYPWWSLPGEMMDGNDPETGKPYEGRQVDLGWYSAKDSRSAGQLKGLARRLSGGQAVPQLSLVDALIKQAVGSVLVRFKVAAGKREGQSFLNIQEVVASQPTAPAT